MATKTGHDAWLAHLSTLPREPWDLHTDFPRDPAPWKDMLGASATRVVAVDSVPLRPEVEWTTEAPKCDECSVLSAVCAALGSWDHGHEVIWVLDHTLTEAGGLPLRVVLQGSLQDVREALDEDRKRVATLWQSARADGCGVEEALEGSLPNAVALASQRSSPCQLAFQRTSQPAREGSFPADICVVLGNPEDAGAIVSSAVHLEYRTDLYSAKTVQVLASHAAALLCLEQPWSSLPVSQAARLAMQPQERLQLMSTCQGAVTAFPECCVHHLFEFQSRGEAASRPALLPWEDQAAPWSYAELDLAAGRVAHALLLLGAQPGGRAPLLLRRSCLLVAAIYGSLRAGQAYVPLDPEWPADRQRVVLEDVKASVLVVGEGVDLVVAPGELALLRLSSAKGQASSGTPLLAEACPAKGAALLELPQEAAEVHVTPDMSVYIIYTSGTTGKPKGVEVPHCGLVGRTQWLQNTWSLHAGSVMVQKTPPTFAISEWEFFWPLCFGAQLALAAHGLHGDAQHVVQLLSQRGVTHSVFVPSLLEQLLDELDGQDLPELKLIIACGEALKSGIALAALRGLPGTELVNLYGPTEASMTMLRLPHEPAVNHLYRCPLGAPIENTLVFCTVPSQEGDLAPLLGAGELYFGGPLLASGYWGLPELTREKFIANPHAPGLLYRTGDLGRWRADGCLEFLGRADSQVKFNGVRLELAEIEAALAGLPRVKATAAFLAPPHHLVAACVLVGGEGAVCKGEQERLREGLRACLPKDRVPTRLELLPALPLTERGKVDRQRLLAGFLEREAAAQAAAVAVVVEGAGADAAEEASPSELRLEQLMREVLGVHDALPLGASFQALGFSSLLLGKLTSRVRRTFGLPGLPATAVYRHPTATTLAQHLAELVAEQEARASSHGDGGETWIAPAPPVWRGESPTSALSWACTLLGLFLDCIVSEFSFLPAYYVFFEVYFRAGLATLCVAAGIILFLDMVLGMLIVTGLKWLLVGRRQPGAFPVFSWEYWKWRLVHRMENYAEEHFTYLIADTPLYNVFLRLQGASVGAGARINFSHLSEVDMLTIGSKVRLERDASVSCARLWNGELQLRPVSIGSGALVAHRAQVIPGTSIPPNMELTAMSSSDPQGPYNVQPRSQTVGLEDPQQRDRDSLLTSLQLFLGVPILMLVETLSDLPVFLILEGLWALLAMRLSLSAREKRHDQKRGRWGWSMIAGNKSGYTLQDKQRVLYPFVALIPWVMTFVHGGAYFLLVVAVKRLLVGEFKEGPVTSAWDTFRLWLMERLTTSDTFDHFMELWVNTEVLSSCYRLLGAEVAPRANMDFFGVVAHDLVHIETDVVFGSSVLLVTSTSGVGRHIYLRRGACVLDHSCVLPGTTVPEQALLGSFTVVPTGQRLEPLTVYTGNEQGRCVRLFQRPLLAGESIEGERVVTAPGVAGTDRVLALPPVAAKQRALEAVALMHHWSRRYYIFNISCVVSAAIFAPLPDVVYWATIVIDFEVYDMFGTSDLGELVSVLLIAPLYLLVTGLMLLVICALKWLLIGRWREGDRHYYSLFHFKWAALMTAFSSLNDLLDSIAGTWLAVAFMRCMGATVGKRVCFFGHGFEYDLLHIGDEACIGDDCDVTAHTVENMVMRMEQVRFESGTSCLRGSVVMPGGAMERGSTLIEHSQVLKGETVPAGAYFGGLPAKLLTGYSSLAFSATSSASSRPRTPDSRRPLLATGEVPLDTGLSPRVSTSPVRFSLELPRLGGGDRSAAYNSIRDD